jgi:hypothetical protein
MRVLLEEQLDRRLKSILILNLMFGLWQSVAGKGKSTVNCCEQRNKNLMC